MPSCHLADISPRDIVDLFQGMPMGVFVVDAHSHQILDINDTALELTGFSLDEAVGTPCFDFICPKEAGRRPVTNLGKAVDNAERTVLHRNGNEIPIIKSVKRATLEGREVLVESFVDISSLKHAQEEAIRAQWDLARQVSNRTRELVAKNQELEAEVARRCDAQRELLDSEERLLQIVDNMPLLIHAHDDEGRIVFWNKESERVLGFSAQEMLEDPEARKNLYSDWEASLEEITHRHSGVMDYEEWETRMRTKDGQDRVIAWSSRSRNAPIPGWRQWETGVDVTERKEADARLVHLAMHDPLTSLPNRALLKDRLMKAIERSRRRSDYHFAVLFIDLDRFKLVNDSMGHAAGDAILVETGERLRRSVRELDTVARLGGDEFVVLLEEIDSDRYPLQAARRVQEALARPFEVSGRAVHLTASIGLEINPTHFEAPEDCIRNANLAMHRAKDTGRNRFEVFTPELHRQAYERMVLEQELETALSREEFSLAYQPIMSADKGSLYGLEVLCRWDHPERGAIAPSLFIPVAEDSELIVPLGLWVLRESCAAMARFKRDKQLEGVVLSVNVSPRQLPYKGFVDSVFTILDETGLDGHDLKLEITETALMQGGEEVIEKLRRLKSRGIRISMDDFGAGYSNMALLGKLPIDNLKIDISFIRLLDDGPKNQEVVRAIVSMAHSLGLSVVAEGVERPQQRASLADMGCEFLQGYLYARPMADGDLAAFCKGLAAPA